jgi:hypothetical protein
MEIFALISAGAEIASPIYSVIAGGNHPKKPLG